MSGSAPKMQGCGRGGAGGRVRAGRRSRRHIRVRR